MLGKLFSFLYASVITSGNWYQLHRLTVMISAIMQIKTSILGTVHNKHSIISLLLLWSLLCIYFKWKKWKFKEKKWSKEAIGTWGFLESVQYRTSDFSQNNIGTFLILLCCSRHYDIISHLILLRWVVLLLLSSFLRWVNWVKDRLHNIQSPTALGQPGIWIQSI